MESHFMQRKTALNLDTNFLKLIAIITMTIDHASKVFMPDHVLFAMIGRIAFPIFAYCLVVGCLYTSSRNRYILRLSIFAVISQPFYVMAFHPTWDGFIENIFVANIFFTLVAGVFTISALMDFKKQWWMLVIALAMEFFLGLDYGLYGILIMVFFYLCRNRRWLAILIVGAWMCTNLLGDFMTVGGIGIDRQLFALLALPFIAVRTNFNPRIHKYFFYGFYPVHLMVIYIFRILLHV